MTLDRIQSTAAAPYLDVFADALTKASYKRATIQRYLRAAAHPKSRVVVRIIMRSRKWRQTGNSRPATVPLRGTMNNAELVAVFARRRGRGGPTGQTG